MRQHEQRGDSVAKKMCSVKRYLFLVSQVNCALFVCVCVCVFFFFTVFFDLKCLQMVDIEMYVFGAALLLFEPQQYIQA